MAGGGAAIQKELERRADVAANKAHPFPFVVNGRGGGSQIVDFVFPGVEGERNPDFLPHFSAEREKARLLGGPLAASGRGNGWLYMGGIRT